MENVKMHICKLQDLKTLLCPTPASKFINFFVLTEQLKSFLNILMFKI